jgi:hypothetical protein
LEQQKEIIVFSLVLLITVSQFVENFLDITLVYKTGNVRMKVIARRLSETTVAVEEQ